DVGEPPAGLVERRVPRDRFPAIALPALGLADAVGIALHVGDGGGLGADVAAAEGIVGIAAHAADRAAFQLDRQPANRLAQHAGMEALRHRRTLARAAPVNSPRGSRACASAP